MMDFIKKYNLLAGVLMAVLLPGIFVFSGPANFLLIRFGASFFCILFLWLSAFILVDFSVLWRGADLKSKRKLYLRIALSFIVTIGMYAAIGFMIDRPRIILFTQIQGEKFYSFKAWFFLILRICLFNGFFLLIKYLFDSNREKQRTDMEMERLKNENLMAMHEALKQQLNPHFLFNSLTTLRALVRRDTSQSLAFIDELSSVYRYMLLHHEQKEVLVQEEIGFLRSYLHLLQIRFGDSIKTRIDIPDHFLHCKMPPNTLQLLIENAVKHNVLSQRRPLEISISVSSDYLTVENNLQCKNADYVSSGLGLRNINTRYQILKGKDIRIEQSETFFKVLLPMN